ncbi:MAG: hypothetical protein KBF99_13025 [Leptospiraceae bacterium]|jgi:hypothetical protein|nr:hypothetical protein [Leptospiraceae bacterium]MBP9164099.1 hypothetical protein [Leptospiraceae bacterium]
MKQLYIYSRLILILLISSLQLKCNTIQEMASIPSIIKDWWFSKPQASVNIHSLNYFLTVLKAGIQPATIPKSCK